MELTDLQKQAVDMIRGENRPRIGVITGGPGTGKTTILREVADAYSLDTVFAAPTGKAAKRISEVTGATSATIHRMLGVGRLQWRTPPDPLPFKTVIVDEASMLDVDLGHHLMRHIGKNTSVFFVGDVNQLPSVGPGTFLNDIIECGRVPVVRLHEVHRSAADSWVVQNAHRLLQGEMIDTEPTHDFKWRPCTTASTVVDAVIEYAVPMLESGSSVQVLSPQKSGECGVLSLNNRLQSRLFRRRHTWEIRGQHIGKGDAVMQTRNDYKLEVFNGESGTVVDITKTDLIVDFDGRIVGYDVKTAQDLMLSYALTVHKAQGSEWDTVVLVCHSSHSFMWNRQLLYTALTRAKKKVILIGDELSVAMTCNGPMSRNTRNTMLQHYIHEVA